MNATKLLVAMALGCLLAVASPAAAPADDARGEKLFHLCIQCHGADGGGNQMFLAPAIAGFSQWYVESQLRNFRKGVRGLEAHDVGGLRMYPMSQTLKSDADVSAVAAYVASLPAVRPEPVLQGGDAARGAAFYAVCGACHGPDAAGIQQMNAPRLNATSDWYLLSTLEKYKQGVRGNNPGNTNAVLMRGMAMQLVDEQAMKDVIAHIMTLGN